MFLVGGVGRGGGEGGGGGGGGERGGGEDNILFHRPTTMLG